MATILAINITFEASPPVVNVHILVAGIAGDMAAYKHVRTMESFETRHAADLAGDAFENGYKLTKAAASTVFVLPKDRTYRT